jgi:putative tryptophan/tyrosine transport system substrate-binding protein
VAGATPLVVRAIQTITTTIPIVSAAVPSDIAFRRPGGNITGAYGVFGDLGGKRIGLLHDLLPRATTIAVLTTPSPRESTYWQQAARVLGLQTKLLIADTNRELDAALASLAQVRPDALLVATGPLFFSRAAKIVAAAEQFAIPAVYFRREFALAGGLMSYAAGLRGPLTKGKGLFI